ncbi:MAG: glycosyl hydrolase, partial [Chloroflexota bacterium]|nr:glycosyl hydrolase [Chloroflexota bacterium]
MDQATFKNPPRTFRAVPFWSWNDDLKLEELVRQIGLMDEAGWGGFFMHSRVGLVTPYLSERWMECIRAAVAEAKGRDMGAYLYDEDKWPSGFAGGLVPAQKQEHRDLALVCKVDDRPAVIEESVALFKAQFEKGQLSDFQLISAEEAEALDWRCERLVQFYPLTAPLGQPWFNDYSYVDLLNPDAVHAFLDSTYERYRQEVGADFGGAVPGIFTDEPTYNHRILARMDQPFVPWTIGLEEYFQEKRGYDLLDRLPDLFFESPTAPGTRYDFWHTLTQRFVESFSQQMYEWCEEHGLAFTGHYVAEDTLRSQTEWIGAAMPHYAYQHIPGIDKLRRDVAQPATVKQLDSAACQLGRERTLCEAYGCAGQNFAFAGRKWIGDWLYLLGVNLLNPHLSLYSMRGARKRDFPANLYYQQPWWPYNQLIADYFARLGWALTQGQRVVDILVIHPIGSAWSLYSPLRTLPVDKLNEQFEEVVESLLDLHRDFHFGDEMLMEELQVACPSDPVCAGRRRASCKLQVEGGNEAALKVGEMTYRVVIVPPGVTLAQSTVALLEEFASAGGRVIAIEPLPTMVEGRPADQVLPEGTKVIELDREALRSALDSALPPDVKLPGAPKVWYHHRRVTLPFQLMARSCTPSPSFGTPSHRVRAEEGELYFLANTDFERGTVVTARLQGEGRLEEWDLMSGEIHPLPSHCADGYTNVTLDFPPVGSRLLVIDPQKEPLEEKSQPLRTVQTIDLGESWSFTRHDPNALTLDYCQYRFEGGRWSERLPVWLASRQVTAAGLGTEFSLRYTFDVAHPPQSQVELVLESPERFSIALNGHPLQYEDQGWWIDISFRRMDITELVRGGENEIVLEGVVGQNTEIEHLYIIGDFAVTANPLRRENRIAGQTFEALEPRFRLTHEEEKLTSGDLVS